MSARANPTFIGLFVCIAIALAVLSVLMFGGPGFFNHKEQFIIYFSDDVNLLSQGSPVKYKGVQIGQVKDILLHYHEDPESNAIPVIIEIDIAHLNKDLGDTTDLSDPQVLAAAIEGGLRAKLEALSYVTGQLYINLDEEINPPPPKARLIEPPSDGTFREYLEIPSVPTGGLNEMMKSVNLALQNIGQVNLKEVADNVNSLLTKLNGGVDQIDFKQINDSLLAVIKSFNDILQDPQLHEILAKANVTLDSVTALSNNLNSQVAPISNEFQLTAQRARTTLDDVDKTLEALRGVVDPQLRVQVEQTLNDVSGAAAALRQLADFIEQHPSALIFGKPSATAPADKATAPGAATPSVPITLPPFNTNAGPRQP